MPKHLGYLATGACKPQACHSPHYTHCYGEADMSRRLGCRTGASLPSSVRAAWMAAVYIRRRKYGRNQKHMPGEHIPV
jgi:hypothetical protein